MTPTDETPRIYVASLSDYNAGRLHGQWIDATQAIGDVWSEINSMLASSREPNAEEWAIHDFDNFGPVRLSEWENLERVVAIAQGIATHGAAFACWTSVVDPTEAITDESFSDALIGSYESIESYADELVEGLGIDISPSSWAPDMLAPYVSLDWHAFAQSLADLHRVFEWGGQIHIFEP